MSYQAQFVVLFLWRFFFSVLVRSPILNEAAAYAVMDFLIWQGFLIVFRCEPLKSINVSRISLHHVGITEGTSNPWSNCVTYLQGSLVKNPCSNAFDFDLFECGTSGERELNLSSRPYLLRTASIETSSGSFQKWLSNFLKILSFVSSNLLNLFLVF